MTEFAHPNETAWETIPLNTVVAGALDMVTQTLEAMARGGMYDQLGGGSGDFKMYDNVGGALATTPAWTDFGGYVSAMALADVVLDQTDEDGSY